MHWKSRGYRKTAALQKMMLFSSLVISAFLLLLMPEGSFCRMIYGQFCPCAAFCMDALAYGERSFLTGGRMMDMISHELPLYNYSISYFGDGMMNEYYKEYVEILMKEAEEGTSGDMGDGMFGTGENIAYNENGDGLSGMEGQGIGNGEMFGIEKKEGENSGMPETGGQGEENSGMPGIGGNGITEGKIETENDETKAGEDYHNGNAEKQLNEDGSAFKITDGNLENIKEGTLEEMIHSGKRQIISLEEYQEFEKLVNKFYTVDSNTYIKAGELDVERLSSSDMRISKNGGGPQILIYHTHSQESYADSVSGDASMTVVGVGEYLAEILRKEYGYQVLHHMDSYDAGVRDYAYSYALPALEKILAENPTIEVVIDLHRDSVADGNRLVTEVNGIPTAKFMFFNGLSRVRELGEINYLPNENLQQNLAFSFQMEKACEEYYPGLTRKIYLKGYRYNMHVKPRTLLIEMGAQNNTVQEARNACLPLARVLDLVLSGKA